MLGSTINLSDILAPLTPQARSEAAQDARERGRDPRVHTDEIKAMLQAADAAKRSEKNAAATAEAKEAECLLIQRDGAQGEAARQGSEEAAVEVLAEGGVTKVPEEDPAAADLDPPGPSVGKRDDGGGQQSGKNKRGRDGGDREGDEDDENEEEEETGELDDDEGAAEASVEGKGKKQDLQMNMHWIEASGTSRGQAIRVTASPAGYDPSSAYA